MNTPVRPELLIFDAQVSLNHTLRAGVTVVFCAESSVDPARIGEGVRAAMAFPADPALVLVIVLKPFVHAYKEVPDELLASFIPEGIPVMLASIDSNRRLELESEDVDENFDSTTMDRYSEEIFSAGLSFLFHTTNPVIRSSPGYHFESPGGRHVSTFVRVANMLISSAHTSFVACMMLNKISDFERIESIMTDTSSINALGHELRRLQGIFFPGRHGAIVGSFGGHSSVSSHLATDPNPATLFVISAASTGSLARKIINERPGSPVVIIVALETAPVGSEYLYAPNSSSTAVLDEKIDTSSFARQACQRCISYNETVVKIDGDQLIPLTPAVYSRLLTRAQALDWAPNHLQALVHVGAARAHFVPVTPGLGAARRPIYFDFQEFARGLMSSGVDGHDSVARLRDDVLAKLTQLIRDFSPTHIIHLPDPSSRELANVAQAIAGPMQPSIVDSRMSYEGAIKATDSNRILVISSVASSGSSLNSLSRDLRPIVRTSTVRYFVLMTRAHDEATWNLTKSNLSVGKFTAGNTTVTSVIEAWLPTERSLIGSSWDDEEELWGRVLSYFAAIGQADRDLGSDALVQMQERLAVLQAGSLVDNLFVANGSAENGDQSGLRLADNFAFWNFEYSDEEITQAAVFMTFAAVMDWSRSPSGSKRAMPHHQGDVNLEIERYYDTSQRSHNLTAIHPFNFDRFNDAITHACLLRGALPWELDYSASSGLSASMFAVLRGVVESYSPDRISDSLVEFLIALACERLRLHPRHLEALIELLDIELSPIAYALKIYIRDNLLDSPA